MTIIFASESYAENLAQDAINGSQAYVDKAIEQHLLANAPHSQYLTKTEAANIYAVPVTVDRAIARHVEDFHQPKRWREFCRRWDNPESFTNKT